MLKARCQQEIVVPMFRCLIALALLLVSGAGFAQQPQPCRWDASLASFNVGQFLLEQPPGSPGCVDGR